MTEEVEFIRGNDRINRLAQQPDIAEDVARARADMAEADRTHAMGLAALRQAAEAAFYVTRRVCLGLQRKDAEDLAHGFETGIIRQLPSARAARGGRDRRQRVRAPAVTAEQDHLLHARIERYERPDCSSPGVPERHRQGRRRRCRLPGRRCRGGDQLQASRRRRGGTRATA